MLEFHKIASLTERSRPTSAEPALQLLWRRALFTALVSVLSTILASSAQAEEATLIRQWVEQLGSPRFAVREAATEKLVAAGADAVDALVAGISTHQVEASVRGLEVLRQLALNDAEGAVRAEQALRALADKKATAVAARAESVLSSLRAARTSRAIKLLRRLGAEISFTATDFEERSLGAEIAFVTLGKSWHGKLSDLDLVQWLTDYEGVNVTLKGKQFDNAWLAQITQYELVVGLQLSRTSMTNEGLRNLANMKKLMRISVRYCALNDDCLVHFEQLDAPFEFLSVFGSGISQQAFQALVNRHPEWRARFGRGGFLGIGGSTFEQNGVPIGCIVSTVTPDQAAHAAGIREFDIITKFNGITVTRFIPQEPVAVPRLPDPAPKEGNNGQEEGKEKPRELTLSELIGQNAAGDRVTVTILRGGEEIQKEVVLGAWP